MQTIAILDTFSLQMRHIFGLQLNTESGPRVHAQGGVSGTVIMFEYGLLCSYPSSLPCPVLPSIRQAWQGARPPIVKLLRGDLGRLEKMQGGPWREGGVGLVAFFQTESGAVCQSQLQIGSSLAVTASCHWVSLGNPVFRSSDSQWEALSSIRSNQDTDQTRLFSP